MLKSEVSLRNNGWMDGWMLRWQLERSVFVLCLYDSRVGNRGGREEKGFLRERFLLKKPDTIGQLQLKRTIRDFCVLVYWKGVSNSKVVVLPGVEIGKSKRRKKK